MIIVSQGDDQAFNFDHIMEIYVLNSMRDGAVVRLLCTDQKSYTAGRYRDMEDAQAALEDMLEYIASGKGGMYRAWSAEHATQRVMMARVEKPDQFSGNGKKLVRRGGS